MILRMILKSTKDEGDQTAKVCYERTIRLSVFDCSQATAYANLIGLKHLAGGNLRSKAPGWLWHRSFSSCDPVFETWIDFSWFGWDQSSLYWILILARDFSLHGWFHWFKEWWFLLPLLYCCSKMQWPKQANSLHDAIGWHYWMPLDASSSQATLHNHVFTNVNKCQHTFWSSV